MTRQRQVSDEIRTCPACGGTWPSDRRNCLACGANLESLPARPAGEGEGQEPLSWTWLDAMADEGPDPGTAEAGDDEQKSGCLARFFPGIG